ncbi:MAG: hypothetical protein ACUVRV_08845 [Cyanobacteriota bacterium]
MTTLLLLSGIPADHADDFCCTGAEGAFTVDNLIVLSGASCSLNGTVVQGNLKVGREASLQASGIRVEGNIQAEGAAAVTTSNFPVGGNIQIKQGDPHPSCLSPSIPLMEICNLRRIAVPSIPQPTMGRESPSLEKSRWLHPQQQC